MFWPAVIVYVRFFFTKGWKRLYGPWISPPFAKRHAVRVVLVFASSGICPYVLHPLRNPVDPVRPRPCIRSQGFKKATCEHSSPISYESFGEPAASSEWQGICTCSSSISKQPTPFSGSTSKIRHIHESIIARTLFESSSIQSSPTSMSYDEQPMMEFLSGWRRNVHPG